MLAQILAKVQKLAADWTTTKAGYIDDNISSRAPSSTALNNTIWTNQKAVYLNDFISSRASQTSVNTISTTTTAVLQDTVALTSAIEVGTTLNEQTYTSSNTWTVPGFYKGFIYVTLAGGGGGGANEHTTGPTGGGGGGGGAVVYRWPIWIDQTETSSVVVTVGTGGAAGTGSGSGSDGVDSSFGNYITCGGGGGGTRGSGTGFGGNGGRLVWNGTNYGTGFQIVPPGIFPAYRNMRLGFYCEGGGGGNGTTGTGADGESCMVSDTTDPWFSAWEAAYFDKEGSNRYKTLLLTHVANNNNAAGGGGGHSWGTGGGPSTTPAYGGGGRGEDADGSPTAQAGASGICIIEWWT